MLTLKLNIHHLNLQTVRWRFIHTVFFFFILWTFAAVISAVRSRSPQWCHSWRPWRWDTANTKTPTTTWCTPPMSHRLCTTCYSRLAWWWVGHVWRYQHPLCRDLWDMLVGFQEKRQSVRSRGFQASDVHNVSVSWCTDAKYGVLILGESLNLFFFMRKIKKPKENHPLISSLALGSYENIKTCQNVTLANGHTVWSQNLFSFIIFILLPWHYFTSILHISCCFLFLFHRLTYISLHPTGVTLGYFWSCIHSTKKKKILLQWVQSPQPAGRPRFQCFYLITLIRWLRQLSTWCVSLGSALWSKPHYCQNHRLLGELQNSIYHFAGPPDSH